MVIMDRFIKIIRLKIIMTNIFSEDIVKIYWNEIWKLHRISRKILSNRRSQFTLKFIEEFMKALGTIRQLLTVYYSQINGQIERINQEVGTFL